MVLEVTYPSDYVIGDANVRFEHQARPVTALQSEKAESKRTPRGNGKTVTEYSLIRPVAIPEGLRCVRVTARVNVADFIFQPRDPLVGGKRQIKATLGDGSFAGDTQGQQDKDVCRDQLTEFHFRLDWDPNRGNGCKGTYAVSLRVTVVDGHLSGSQVAKLKPAAVDVEEYDKKGNVKKGQPIGSPQMEQQPDGSFMFRWPPREKDCGGPYHVSVSLAKTLLPISQTSFNGTAVVKRDEETPVEFDASVNMGGGGGEPPKKPGEEPLAGAEEAAVGGPGELYPGAWMEAGPGEMTLELPYPGAEMGRMLSDLEQSGAGGFDPSGATTGTFGAEALSRAGIYGPVGPGGPPWTQLDIIVDPNASHDARDAVNLHDIEGPNIVRGHFNGRFRGFVSGPM